VEFPQSDAVQHPDLATHVVPQQRYRLGSHAFDWPQTHPGEIVDEHARVVASHEYEMHAVAVPQSDARQQLERGRHVVPQQRWVAGSHAFDVPQMHAGDTVEEHAWVVAPHEYARHAVDVPQSASL
jgi:hypothetical protein